VYRRYACLLQLYSARGLLLEKWRCSEGGENDGSTFVAATSWSQSESREENGFCDV
jgi:hypothetical protein